MSSSVRGHVLKWLVGAVALGSICLALATYASTLVELNRVFDEELKQVALTLLTRYEADAEAREPSLHMPAPANDDLAEYAFVTQVWTLDGRLLFASDPRVHLPFIGDEGFRTLQRPDGEWRVHTDRSVAHFIQAAQPIALRRQLAIAAALRILIPCLAAGPLLALLVGLALRRGLYPLTATAADLSHRSAVSLTPIEPNGVPREMLPLLAAINSLMDKLARAMEAQRRFAADAAHELRTPLAAIDLQLQLLLQAPSVDTRREAAGDIRDVLSRATHLVDELLLLASAEHGVAAAAFTPVDLGSLARAAVVAFNPLAEANGIDLGADVDAEKSLMVDGDGGQLLVMINCLIDNALRYTPRPGVVDVIVRREAASTSASQRERILLSVVDSGPGIPMAERGRVFERFYRGEARPRRSGTQRGSGLGLAIVKTIAQAHEALVALEDVVDPSGTERPRFAVRLTLPRAAADEPNR